MGRTGWRDISEGDGGGSGVTGRKSEGKKACGRREVIKVLLFEMGGMEWGQAGTDEEDWVQLGPS